MAIALLVIPTVLYLGAYSICASVYKNYFGAGFISSALKSFTNGLKPSYQSFPLALFAGFGGVELSSSLSSLNYGEMTTYYSFLNYFTCIFALACFVFVTFVAFFGKKVTFFKNVKTIKNKYKITTVAFLSLCLPVFLGLTSSPYGFAGASVFMCVYVAFAYSILARCLKIKVVNVIFSCATIVGLVAFGMAYVGYIGLALPEIAKSILYSWQVL